MLEDVQLTNGCLRISPLRAITPDEAEGALAPLYAHLPSIWIVDEWVTGVGLRPVGIHREWMMAAAR